MSRVSGVGGQKMHRLFLVACGAELVVDGKDGGKCELHVDLRHALKDTGVEVVRVLSV